MSRLTAAAAALLLVLTACNGGNREAESIALADQLHDITVETNDALNAHRALLQEEYDVLEQLYERSTDLRLPTTFAVSRDKAQRIEPPPGSEAQLDRYIDFLGELLLASEQLDFAVADESPEGIVIAAISMEVAAGTLAVTLGPESCEQLTPGFAEDLCDPGGLDGYEQQLSYELRRFVASFRPAFRISDTFGDVIRGRVLGTLQADAALVLEDAASRILELDTGPAYERLAMILADYFPAAAAAWAEHEASPTASDPLIYAAIIDSLEAERTATQDQLEAEHELIVSANPNSAIATITGIWFGVAVEG